MPIDPTAALGDDALGDDASQSDSGSSYSVSRGPTAESHFDSDRSFAQSQHNSLARSRTAEHESMAGEAQRKSGDEKNANIGRVLGSYRLVSLLGQGGMGQVYKAEHVMLGRKVALKLLRPEYAAKRDAVHRFFQEARAVNAIGHENIVDITDYVQLEDGETFFIMELLTGNSLGQLIRNRRQPLQPHTAMNIALQVTDALQAAHEKNIIHRDLKPDNIFVIEDLNRGLFVKLLDFGVAKLVGEAAADLSWETAAGSVIGTPAYMSPEQATGLDVDHRTDIYSLGAILYEMFTGKPVFKAKSFGEFVIKHINELPVPPSEACPEGYVPLTIERIIMRCLEKDPFDRYQDVIDLREDLARATATMERSIRRRVRANTRGLPSPGSRKALNIVLGTLVTIAAGGAFWFASNISGDSRGHDNQLGFGDAGLEPAPPALARHGWDPATLAPTTDATPTQGTARLQLISRPPGATVYRPGEPISLGTTPLVLTLPATGGHIDFVFRLPGYEPTKERVKIAENAVVSVALEPVRGVYAESGPEDSDPSDIAPNFPRVKTGQAGADTAKERRNRPKRRSPRKRTRHSKLEKPLEPGETLDPLEVN